MRFCYVILCGVYIPVFLSGFAVFVPSLSPRLFRLLSDLKFYYMHVKVSCKGIDTEADLSVFIHATLISRSSNPQRIRRLPNNKSPTPPPTPHPQGVLVGLMAGSPEWTGLKGLKLLIALASTFQRIFWLQKNCFQADRTLKPGSAAGKKWQKTDWNGIKNRVECLDRPFSLPRLYRLAWLALFFFSLIWVFLQLWSPFPG